ncbi:MAG: type IV toxin-antitoxin system AbiEi family antitoxin [Sulfuricellaceae bacterium]|jgi:hypothetical protein
MREARREQEILGQAIAALEAATGLHAQVQFEPGGIVGPDALIDIAIDDRAVRFAAEIKAIDRFQTLGAIKARADIAPYPPLLVAPYITEATAEKCRELHLPFIDEAGNAYLEAPGLFVYVTGKRRPIQTRTAPAFRALTPAGLRIVFALLNFPYLAAAPYREIAKVARVALGTVGDALADLEDRGYLAPEKPGPRRLLAPERLQDEWVTHYPIKLRPKLNARRFTAPTHDWWRNLDIGQHHAYWGGEIAAEKLTGYLKPERITIYVDGKPDKLILANRLRPDVNGEIEILETFWATEEARQRNDVAPPLLVYADLMATTDPRNIETAKLIRDHHLTQVRHAA